MSLFEELKRRNVFRVGIAYVLLGWVVLQAADFALDLIDAPNWIIQALFIIGLVGLPFALFFAWAFELTPEGIKREEEVDRSQSITPTTGRKLDRAIIVFLALAVVFLLAERFWHPPAQTTRTLEGTEASAPRAAGTPEDAAAGPAKSVAVLPFLPLSSGDDDEYFADGLTEEILNSLAQVPDLTVTSRTSAFHFKGKDLPIAEIAQQLGVDHVVEGSVRRSGSRLRVTAQLIRVTDDTHLWSENYDRTNEDAIAVQEDIAQKIAEALNVFLDEDTKRRMSSAGFRDVDAFIAYQKGVELHNRAHGDQHMLAMLEEGNRYLKQALEIAPTSADAWRFYSDYFTHLLLDDAVGKIEHPLDGPAIEAAFGEAERAFVQAARHAPNSGARTMAELDLAILRGDGRRWASLLEQLLGQESCQSPQWIQLITFQARFNEAYAQRLRSFIDCDPLLQAPLNHLAHSELWSARPEDAIATLEQAPTTFESQFAVDTRVRSLAMLGRISEARSVARIDLTAPANREITEVLLLAVEGNDDAAMDRARAASEEFELDDYQRLHLAAWLGDRDTANQMAARIDQARLGHLALMAATYWCVCGAPFDLEAAPRFAEIWEASGLDWPPPTPLKLPMKDW